MITHNKYSSKLVIKVISVITIEYYSVITISGMLSYSYHMIARTLETSVIITIVRFHNNLFHFQFHFHFYYHFRSQF